MGKWIKPISARFHGDQQQAENMIGQVRKELGVLENLMQFRGLAIGQRSRQFEDGSAFKVGIVNGRAIADIITPGNVSLKAPLKAPDEQRLLKEKAVRSRPGGEEDGVYYGEREWILKKEEFGSVVLVISSKSNNEAFAYDIINREVVVEKSSKDQVLTELSEMTPFKHVNPQQLLTSETSTEETEIISGMGGATTTIPEKWNVPSFEWRWFIDSFYWDDSEAPYGVSCSALGLPDLYGVLYAEPGEDALERCLVVARDYVIVRDPDLISEDYKGQYLIHYTCPIQDVGHYPGAGYDPGDRLYFSGGRIYYHRLFDNEHDTSWVSQNWRVAYDSDIGACANRVQQFAELIQNKPCYSDPVNAEKKDRRGQLEHEVGVASNDEVSVCFENMVHRWDSEYVKDLRLFFRHKNPPLSYNEQQALDLINFERAKFDLPECHWNHVLYRACLRHSQDMADNDFYGHQGTDGTWAADRADQEGRNAHAHVGRITGWLGSYEFAILTHVLAENVAQAGTGVFSEYDFPENNIYPVYYETITQPEYLAFGHAENAVALWLSSTQGHRELILNEIDGMEEGGIYQQLPDVAIACVLKENKSYWTYLRNVSYNFWPGFSCVPTEGIIDYINTNFNFNGTGDEMKMLDVFLMEAEQNGDSED